MLCLSTTLKFAQPEQWLWALGALALLAGLRFFVFRRPRPGLFFPGAAWLAAHTGPGRILPALARGLVALAALALIAGLGRPYTESYREETAAEGVDIALVLDISTSMSAEDFQPHDRLESAKAVIRDFIRRRPHDRLALITFAADAYVVCPLTADHYTLEALLESVELIPFDADGTAIGMALASAVNRLRDSPARSRLAVLLTDGVNNRGEVSPLQAAEFCKRFGVRVYAAGIGTDEETRVLARAPDGSPTWIRTRVEFDPQVLSEIARATGGQSFLASDAKGLDQVYREIDRMEKTVLEKRRIPERRDLAPLCFWIALGCLVLGAVVYGFVPACA
jgi:Ca-activated chloride channel family protein